MQSFCGRLPEANPSIVGAALLSLRTSLSGEMELVNRDEFNVAPLLGPSPQSSAEFLSRRLVVTIGTIPPSIVVILNLRTSPSIPWMLPVTAGRLLFFWWYVSGHVWPLPIVI